MLTKLGRSTFASIPAFTFLSWITGEPTYFYTSMIILFLLIFDYMIFKRTVRDLLKVKVNRKLSDNKVYSGSSVNVNLEIYNPHNKGLGPISVRDVVQESVSEEGPPEMWTFLDANSKTILRYSMKIVGLGLIEFKGVEVMTFDPLGLMEHKFFIELYSEVESIPKPFPLQIYRPSGGIARGGEDMPKISIKKGGVDYSSIREYQSGDESKSIVWRLVAKDPAHRLFVKERRVRGRELNIVIIDSNDSMKLGPVGKRKIDIAIKVALIISQAALLNDEELLIMSYPEGSLEFFREWSRSTISKLLMFLSKIRVGGETDYRALYSDLKKYLVERSKIYLITDVENVERVYPLLTAINRRGRPLLLAIINTPEFFKPKTLDRALTIAYDYLTLKFLEGMRLGIRQSKGIKAVFLGPEIRPARIMREYEVIQTWS